MLRCRSAGESELELLAKWNHQLIEDEGHRNPMSEEELKSRMKDWLNGSYKCLVFDHAEKDVGYLLYREDSDKIYLRQLFVARDQRRRGFGKSMAQHCLDSFRSSEKRLTVEVLANNEAGIAFWRALGFRDYCLELEFPIEKSSKQGWNDA